MSQYTSQVLAIELMEQAVEDARWTAAFNDTLLTIWGEIKSCNYFSAIKRVMWEMASTLSMTCGEEGMVFWSGKSWVLMIF